MQDLKYRNRYTYTYTYKETQIETEHRHRDRDRMVSDNSKGSLHMRGKHYGKNAKIRWTGLSVQKGTEVKNSMSVFRVSSKLVQGLYRICKVQPNRNRLIRLESAYLGWEDPGTGAKASMSGFRVSTARQKSSSSTSLLHRTINQFTMMTLLRQNQKRQFKNRATTQLPLNDSKQNLVSKF